MIGAERPKESINRSLITLISVHITTILAIILFGR